MEQEHHMMLHSTGRALCLSISIRLGYENLMLTNTLAYFAEASTAKKKKFYRTDNRNDLVDNCLI